MYLNPADLIEQRGLQVNDIYVGIVIAVLLSCCAFVLAVRVAGRVSMPVVLLLALLAVGAVILHAFVLQENLLVARWLPVSNLIVIGNCSPVAIGWLAGLTWARVRGGTWRKCISVLPLIAAGLYATARPLLGQPPDCHDNWEEDVCIQTSEATCSAACAATLLRFHGIPATEEEMARLCFTRVRGTPKFGLYRGLKIKTTGTPWRVAVYAGDVDSLVRDWPGPIQISVKLKKGAHADPRYETEWGWTPGVAHAVVILGLTKDGKVEVGDPSTGRETWTLDNLRVLWNGRGYYLTHR